MSSGRPGSATTSFAALDAAARHATIIRAGNMSLGVNLLTRLVQQIASALDSDFDIEVVENTTATRSMRPPAPR
jgi:4-hydroxy-tetrahydrodipicolinate reductase